MKIKVAGQERKDESTVTLELTMDRGIEGEALISDKEKNWSIVSFREVDGKLSLVRYANVFDKRFNVNENGQIEEVDE